MDQLIAISLLSGLLVFHIIFVSIRDARYQRTIDKLTDKLMAKDLTEYRRGSVELPQEPKMRKPISFYDDPSIELDEDKVN